MNKKLLIITLSILLVLGLAATIPLLNKRVLQKSFSSNILLITQPVMSFSGKVEKIEGNEITVSQNFTGSQNILPPAQLAINPANQISPLPTPKTMTVTYHVSVTDKTRIYQPPLNVNYLFKTTALPGAPALPGIPVTTSNLTIKDVKVGQYITVNSQVDLRILENDTFEAAAVNLPQIANVLNGKIVSVEGNTLTLKAFPPGNAIMMGPAVNIAAGNAAPAAPQEKEYRINITSDTEISRMSTMSSPVAVKAGEMPQPPQNEKLALSDLKNDMQITVYAAQDVNENSELTALRIEPVIVPVPVISVIPVISIMPAAALPSSIPSPATASPSGTKDK